MDIIKQLENMLTQAINNSKESKKPDLKLVSLKEISTRMNKLNHDLKTAMEE